jgi:hypothetical protein
VSGLFVMATVRLRVNSDPVLPDMPTGVWGVNRINVVSRRTCGGFRKAPEVTFGKRPKMAGRDLPPIPLQIEGAELQNAHHLSSSISLASQWLRFPVHGHLRTWILGLGYSQAAYRSIGNVCGWVETALCLHSYRN